MSELLLGCGNSRKKKIFTKGQEEFTNLVTCDFDTGCNPDVLHDLNHTPWPFENDTFEEVHAYEVLEHLGTQGDFKSFFATFSEIYRILKPGGKLFATCPAWNSLWAWGDPGHTRIISEGSLAFLSQEQYKQQIGKTDMTDYRSTWKGDFVTEYAETRGGSFTFVLRAVK